MIDWRNPPHAPTAAEQNRRALQAAIDAAGGRDLTFLGGALVRGEYPIARRP